ncbi:hypothetical protein SNEBB_011061, partial [Seison nebaliae]
YGAGRIFKLAERGQGVVYKMDIPGDIKVLKFFDKASSLIIEANALIGLQLHGPQIGNYVLKDIMSGNYTRRRRDYLTNLKDFVYFEKQGDYCAIFPFIQGKELYDQFEAREALNHNLKRILRFIVQLLRQIQAIHFTLNRYALTEPGQQDFLGVNTYANAHVDIHDSNILVDYDTPDNIDAVLIDYGLRIGQLLQTKEDAKIHIYNNILRSESGVVAENKISIHRILNFGQNIDFCTIAVLAIRHYYGLGRRRNPLPICADYRWEMMKKFKKAGRELHFMTYLQKLAFYYNRNPNLTQVLRVLFHNVFAPMDYGGWVTLVQLFHAPL